MKRLYKLFASLTEIDVYVSNKFCIYSSHNVDHNIMDKGRVRSSSVACGRNGYRVPHILKRLDVKSKKSAID